jgi:hypothetical protein
MVRHTKLVFFLNLLVNYIFNSYANASHSTLKKKVLVKSNLPAKGKMIEYELIVGINLNPIYGSMDL